MIKDYLIKTRLGVGSYGTVFKVTKKNSLKAFVIKQISLLGLNDKQISEYKTEAKLLSSIKSNYVVKYYDSFIENHNLNIVMEYCEGGDLYQYIEKNKKIKKKLKEKTIWEIFIKMILGLSAMHKKNILHRDIKAQNIFLTKNLDVKVGDLGVAKKLIETNFAKTFIGTPYYLSPEICKELPYNNKSDIWAVGCILYQLCTFNYPFDAKSQGALLSKILNNTPEKIDTSFYSKYLQKMIDLLLNKNYEERPGCDDILKMQIILDKIKNYNIKNDFINEDDNKNNIIIKKNSFKSNKITQIKILKEPKIDKDKYKKKIINISNSNNIINSKNKFKKNIFYFDCNENTNKTNKIRNSKNKLIKEAVTKEIKKQTNKNNNKVLILNADLKNINTKNNKKKIKTKEINCSKEIIINNDINSNNNKEIQLKISNDNIKNIKTNDTNIIKHKKIFDIKEFANDLNSYVNKYKKKEDNIINKDKKEKYEETNLIEKKEINDKNNNNIAIKLNKIENNIYQNKIINNNINININNISNNNELDKINNNNILNSIMNFKIINNKNESDIQININNNSNILNRNTSNTISEDETEKNLYSEEENSEDQKEYVKEIKEIKESKSVIDFDNKNKELNLEKLLEEKDKLKEKINIIKDNMLSLLGGIDYNYIINLYNSANNENIDKIYKRIEDFVNNNYDEIKKENFDNLYYLLIALDCKLIEKENQIKSFL